MSIFSKNSKERRGVQPSRKKQQSYHYSAQRSQSERQFGRHEAQEEDERSGGANLIKKLRLLPSLASIILILTGLFYVLHVSPDANIVTEGSGGFIGDRAAVEKVSDELMGSSLLNRSKLTFDESKLEDQLNEKFPEFSSIDVSVSLFRQKPVVKIRFAQPALILTNGTNNYILSREGVVLADITRNEPDIDTTKLLLVQDETGVDVAIGKVALTSDQVKYILGVAFQTTAKNLKLQTLVLVPGGGELHARYAGQNYYVKFNLYEDAKKSSGTYLAAKQNIEAKGITPAEYIDVRIPERAYVK